MRNNNLKLYFPIIREREDIRKEIHDTLDLCKIFRDWNYDQQEMFLDFCSGVKGAKMLYVSW